TTAQPVEFPNGQRVAMLQSFEATGEGRALRRRAADTVIGEGLTAAGFFQSGELQGGVLVIRRDAGIAVFHSVALARSRASISSPVKSGESGHGSGQGRLASGGSGRLACPPLNVPHR